MIWLERSKDLRILWVVDSARAALLRLAMEFTVWGSALGLISASINSDNADGSIRESLYKDDDINGIPVLN